MNSTIRTLKMLSLGALVALGCASTSTESAPDENATKAPQAVTAPPATVPSLQPVYFDTDQWVLRADARGALEVHAEAIRQHPEWGVFTIQGHCDERGTAEYNITLGDRRAKAVKSYLVDLGVSKLRLETMTYGEDRPAVAGHDEKAWRYNRRSEFANDALQSASR
jgi:peptidoglycan-associated lipoprotein